MSHTLYIFRGDLQEEKRACVAETILLEREMMTQLTVGEAISFPL